MRSSVQEALLTHGRTPKKTSSKCAKISTSKRLYIHHNVEETGCRQVHLAAHREVLQRVYRSAVQTSVVSWSVAVPKSLYLRVHRSSNANSRNHPPSLPCLHLSNETWAIGRPWETTSEEADCTSYLNTLRPQISLRATSPGWQNCSKLGRN